MNSLIFFKENTFEPIAQIIWTLEEFDNIKSNFNWCIGPDGFVVNSEDTLSKDQRQIIFDIFPGVRDNLSIKEFDVVFSDTMHFFSLKKEWNERFFPFKEGPPRIYGEQCTPKNNRALICDSDSQYFLEWFHEFGLFKKTKKSNEKITYFIHPITKFFMFRNEEEFERYKFEFNKDRWMPKELIKDNQLFIRVINVYEINKKALMFRVVNEEFFSSGLHTMILPYENDIDLFFRSYKVTSDIAEYIEEYCDSIHLDFNFNKYEYYLEVLSADDFIYSFNDSIKNLKY